LLWVLQQKKQSKDYALILNDIRRALRGIPSCSLCYLALSKVHQRTHDQQGALTDLEEAVRLDPTLSEAWYRLAALYDQAGRHNEGQKARRRFEELKENKTNRDADILRSVFLNVLGGESASHGNR
jgi:Flp pilus assembly protein TadD